MMLLYAEMDTRCDKLGEGRSNPATPEELGRYRQ